MKSKQKSITIEIGNEDLTMIKVSVSNLSMAKAIALLEIAKIKVIESVLRHEDKNKD